MPVIPVAAALWSVGAAYTATAGFTAMAAMSTFQIIGTVSAVVGAVGAVTKNKTLQKIGLIGSAVGAVGSFAQASGWLEGVGLTKTGGDAFNKAFTSGSVFKGSETTGTINQGASTVTDAASKTTSLPTTPAPAPVTGELPRTLANANANISGVTDTLAAGAAPPVPPADTSFLSTFEKFAKDNPMASYAMVTTAGNFVAGAFDETAAAEAALAKQQRANLAAPLPVWGALPQQAAQTAAGYTIDPVTGKVVAPRPVAPGLLNTVTGVPA